MSRRVKVGVTANTPLTGKQERFVEEYLKDFNGSRAAIAAGYSKKSAGVIATQNLDKLNIAAAIAAGKAKISNKTQIDARFVLDAATELHRRCMEKGKGFYPNAAARALELIGKHIDVNAFMRDEQHLHVHLNGLQERLGSARTRIGEVIDVKQLEKPSTTLLDDRDEAKPS